MADYRYLIDALNAIDISAGGTGGHIYMIDALNEWAVQLGGTGGHKYTIDALNEIAGLESATTGLKFDVEELNAICTALGGTGGHFYYIDALNELADLDLGGGGAPDWVPDGAIAFIDAVNEHYWDGTSETTLAAMISGITRDGDGLITASGGFDAIGEFFSALAWPMTIVVTANDININVLNYVTADPLAYAFLGMHNSNATSDDFDSNFLQVQGVDADANQKIAATFSASKLAISVEGATVVIDDSLTLNMPAFTAITVLSLGDDTGRVSQIAVYPIQADADLVALSAV